MVSGSKINENLGKPADEVTFKEFEEVRNVLKEAISKKEVARAIKRLCIWTDLISSSDLPLVFYDVHGYDSAITLLKEQTTATTNMLI